MKTARQEYIEILSSQSANFTPSPADPNQLRLATFCGELIDAGYLHGGTLRDQHGIIRGSAVSGVTVQGRLFLDQLSREEKEATPWARFKKYGVPLITYAAGVLTPVLSDLLKNLFQLQH
jgi:hypothetical protein